MSIAAITAPRVLTAHSLAVETVERAYPDTAFIKLHDACRFLGITAAKGERLRKKNEFPVPLTFVGGEWCVVAFLLVHWYSTRLLAAGFPADEMEDLREANGEQTEQMEGEGK